MASFLELGPLPVQPSFPDEHCQSTVGLKVKTAIRFTIMDSSVAVVFMYPGAEGPSG